MLITLSDKVKKDLEFVKSLPTEALSEFVKTALEFLRNGAKPNLYNSAARALNAEVRQIEGVVEAVAFLFAESARLNITEQEFVDSLAVNGVDFDADLISRLKQLYLEQKETIRSIQKELTFDLPHFVNVDWRLDVQVASRTLRSQLTPVFTLRFDTEENGKPKHQFLQTDYSNLKHICDELEVAIKEIKAPYCRRIMRNIK